MNDIAHIQTNQVATAAEIRTHVQRIQEVMQAVMIADTHYGTIPGTQKPTLYKAGSEVLLTTFRLAVDPIVEDLSDGEHFRYRVAARGVHQGSGIVVGAGIGEASTAEEKYCWRAAVCQEEFDDADPTRRRVKYAKGRDGGFYTINQIRTNPADLANTVLKMAKKRAQIDLCLTALAASDIFTQDLDDLPDELRQAGDDRPRGRPRTTKPAARSGNGAATEKQVGFLRTKLKHAGLEESDLLDAFDLESLESIPFAKVNDALAWIASPPIAEA